MWRTVIINQGEKITVQNNWLVVLTDDTEAHIPIGDIYSIVIDNRMSLMSVGAITALTNAGVHILFCDEKHIPVSIMQPLNTHYKPLAVVKKQLKLTSDFKHRLWQLIIKEKISNQCACLKFAGILKEKIEPIERYIDEVELDDITNREGLAAKQYFKALFGAGFYRASDDVTNAALNYGYTILRSAVSKTLVGYGYNCVIGLHHINEQNPYNLADDMMEPLRPVVDLWVDENCENLVDVLTRSNRSSLINLVNTIILWDNKKMRIRYAIDKYISSLTTAIERDEPSLIKIPILIKNDVFFEDEGDD